MTQTITAKELLAQIEKRYFKGAGLAKASKLESDERRAFVLAQVERLLTEKAVGNVAVRRLLDS